MMNDTIIEILIDKSGSMGFMKGDKDAENKYLIDGKTRMSLIKKLLISEIIPTIDFSSKIIIRTFRTGIKMVNNKAVQTGTEIDTIFDDKYNRIQIENAINKLENPGLGGTPISTALEKAYENLVNYPNSDRKIILLTDGEENNGGNYIKTFKKIENIKGIRCKTFIIGIALNQKNEKSARSIASGGFYNIKSQTFEKNEIKRVITPIKKAILKDTLNKNLNNTPKKTIIENKLNIISKKGHNKELSPFDKIENKIKNYISTGQELLDELSKLKENIAHNDILTNSSINSTTLTIDEDYSESLRIKSETFIYDVLCKKYSKENVIWLNKNGEDFKPYDFALTDSNNEIYKYIDCKGTSKTKRTFYLTSNEWEFFINNRENYDIYRVFNIDSLNPNFYHIDSLLNSILNGIVVPYLTKPEILKENRVFLTLL